MTGTQALECDRLLNYLLREHNHRSHSDRLGENAFSTQKNFDQVNEIVELILAEQPKEIIRVQKSDDSNWLVEGTGLLFDFMQQGGMKFQWDGQIELAKIQHQEKVEKERLERENLKLNIDLNKKVIKDYPKTKSRAKRNEWVAWAGIILSILSIILQKACN